MFVGSEIKIQVGLIPVGDNNREYLSLARCFALPKSPPRKRFRELAVKTILSLSQTRPSIRHSATAASARGDYFFKRANRAQTSGKSSRIKALFSN